VFTGVHPWLNFGRSSFAEAMEDRGKLREFVGSQKPEFEDTIEGTVV
jgi:hypothetical protein